MSQLEDKNQDQITLYITQKSEFMAVHMPIDQINSVLQKADDHQQVKGLHAVRTPKFFPSGTQLWIEMPVDIIRKASEEHKECMKSIDDARRQTTKIYRCWENIQSKRTK